MRRTCLVLGTALLLAGCEEERPAPGTPPGGDAAGADATARAQADAGWSAALRPGPGHPEVRGSATAHARADSTVIEVELAGGAPGVTHPWHVHQGTCGNDQGYVHEPEAYPPLRLDPQGRGTARATVPATLRPDGRYYVNVHGAEDHDDTVACGELARG